MGTTALLLAVFLACAVEAVEALTIVLAAGTARGWRSALAGLSAAMAVLAVLLAVAGPALTALPLDALRLVVGTLLLIFGLGWLRKAVLRAAGHKALHDETLVFAATLDTAHHAGPGRGGVVGDWYGFTLAFKGVLLEGIEVAFIVLTIGANQHHMVLAAAAALSAVLVVAGLGLAVRAPLSRIPENSMKFVVGVMLSAFGMFWAAEGAGAHWPAGELALPVLIVIVGLYSLVLVAWVRPRRSPAAAPTGGRG